MRHALHNRLTALAARSALAVLLVASPGLAVGQQNRLTLPPDVTALEGLPEVQVETTREGASRRVLGRTDAEGSRLQIRVEDGRLFWGGSNEPLAVHESGAYTYLSSATEPGRYVRLSRLNDRLTYVEHVDKSDRSVTFWGELRIVLGSTRR
jgi:hypothetical protein